MEKIINLSLEKALHCDSDSSYQATKMINDFAKYNLCNHINYYIHLTNPNIAYRRIDDHHIFRIYYRVPDKKVYGSILTYMITAPYYELDKICEIEGIYGRLSRRHFELPNICDCYGHETPLHFLALYYKIKYKDLVK